MIENITFQRRNSCPIISFGKKAHEIRCLDVYTRILYFFTLMGTFRPFYSPLWGREYPYAYRFYSKPWC